PINSYST
ncbi:unnamed protein product, partial [Allacma fusca]